MSKTAIISVDGHVRASRSEYRNYVKKRFLGVFDDWAKGEEAAGAPESGNLSAGLDPTSQWDSDLRLKDMESQGVVAEVLFPNGLPFQARPADDVGSFSDHEIERQARLAYNRWLADFCAQTPGRRAGQALISFEDVDLAVGDIHWAKEHGLGGVMMPALLPGGIFFFDPALDPVWAACVEVGLPISQHGGTGRADLWTTRIRRHHDVGPRALLLLRPLPVADDPRWRLRALPGPPRGLRRDRGRLDRSGHSQAGPPPQLGRRLDRLGPTLQRMRQFAGSARDYWAVNCFAGISPFTDDQVPLEELARPSGEYQAFAIGCDNAMFGVDYPHFESVFPETKVQVDALGASPEYHSRSVPQNPLRERSAAVRLRPGFPGARHRADRPRGRRGRPNLIVADEGFARFSPGRCAGPPHPASGPTASLIARRSRDRRR